MTPFGVWASKRHSGLGCAVLTAVRRTCQNYSRRPCSDFVDILRRPISCRFIIVEYTSGNIRFVMKFWTSVDIRGVMAHENLRGQRNAVPDAYVLTHSRTVVTHWLTSSLWSRTLSETFVLCLTPLFDSISISSCWYGRA